MSTAVEQAAAPSAAQKAAASTKRRNGVYYTSEVVAEIVSRWALAAGAQRVLDPSFGGCVFLRVAQRQLAAAGIRDPGAGLYGVDVDPAADAYADLVAAGVPAAHLARRDFFTVAPADVGGPFDAVVGNPPYVRHHLLDEARLAPARAAARHAGVELSGRADLWAYFLVHALQFVRSGGRLAFLLPAAVLHADYAGPVLAHLGRRAREVQLVEVRAHLFADASERTVVLLADGVGDGPCRAWDHVEVDDHLALAAVVDTLLTRGHASANGVATAPDADAHAAWKWQAAGIDAATRACYRALCQAPGVTTLGATARVRIGVVTGANRFFVRPRADMTAFEAEGAFSVGVVSRAGWLAHPRWRATDQRDAESGGRHARLLVVPPELALGPHLAAAVARAEEAGLHTGSHCGRRSTWYSLDDLEAPDTFLPYMGAVPPRLVANESEATCTNAVHRVWWTKRHLAARVTLGSWTTLWALAAELYGRSYGGGVLKLEPTAAASMPVPAIGTRAELAEVDEVARRSGRAAAVEAADRLVLQRRVGLDDTDVERLRQAAVALAHRR